MGVFDEPEADVEDYIYRHYVENHNNNFNSPLEEITLEEITDDEIDEGELYGLCRDDFDSDEEFMDALEDERFSRDSEGKLYGLYRDDFDSVEEFMDALDNARFSCDNSCDGENSRQSDNFDNTQQPDNRKEAVEAGNTQTAEARNRKRVNIHRILFVAFGCFFLVLIIICCVIRFS